MSLTKKQKALHGLMFMLPVGFGAFAGEIYDSMHSQEKQRTVAQNPEVGDTYSDIGSLAVTSECGSGVTDSNGIEVASCAPVLPGFGELTSDMAPSPSDPLISDRPDKNLPIHNPKRGLMAAVAVIGFGLVTTWHFNDKTRKACAKVCDLETPANNAIGRFARQNI